MLQHNMLVSVAPAHACQRRQDAKTSEADSLLTLSEHGSWSAQVSLAEDTRVVWRLQLGVRTCCRTAAAGSWPPQKKVAQSSHLHAASCSAAALASCAGRVQA